MQENLDLMKTFSAEGQSRNRSDTQTVLNILLLLVFYWLLLFSLCSEKQKNKIPAFFANDDKWQ